MDARDISVTAPAAAPEADFDASPPAYFSGASIHEMSQIRFRCSYCGMAHFAAVLPHSPQIAKFHCRQCDHVLEIQTRPSAMDSVEDEFNLRLDMKNLAASGKSFSLPSRFRGGVLLR